MIRIGMQKKTKQSQCVECCPYVNDEDCFVWLRSCIVDDVQIHEFFEFQIVRLHGFNNVGEERGDILSHRHGRDHFLHCIFDLITIQGVQIRLQLVNLTLLGGLKKLRVATLHIQTQSANTEGENQTHKRIQQRKFRTEANRRAHPHTKGKHCCSSLKHEQR